MDRYCVSFRKVTTFMDGETLVAKISCEGCPMVDSCREFKAMARGGASEGKEHRVEANSKESLKQHLEELKQEKDKKLNPARQVSEQLVDRLRMYVDLEHFMTSAFAACFIDSSIEDEVAMLDKALEIISKMCPVERTEGMVYNYEGSLLKRFICYDMIDGILKKAKSMAVVGSTKMENTYLGDAYDYISSRLESLFSRRRANDSRKKYRVLVVHSEVAEIRGITTDLREAVELFRATLIKEFGKVGKIAYSCETGDWSWLGDVRNAKYRDKEVVLEEL